MLLGDMPMHMWVIEGLAVQPRPLQQLQVPVGGGLLAGAYTRRLFSST